MAFGCKPDTNIISPNETTPKPQSKLIILPAIKSGLSIEVELTRYKDIDGSNGGTFTEQFEFQSQNGNVSITSQLVFPAGAYSGIKTISQTFNTETASLEFGSSMLFNIPVKYSLTVSGLDLTGINPATLDFVYVSPNGSITGVIYDSITMDSASGSLTVTNAQLNHFSRYGFVN